MKRTHGMFEFESEYVESRRDGWSGFDLYRSGSDARRRVARVVFWDADGQFALETFEGDVPLVVVEALIEEAKTSIKTA